jgi:putative redox protein
MSGGTARSRSLPGEIRWPQFGSEPGDRVKDGDDDRIERTLRFSKALEPEQRSRLLEIAGKTPVTKTVMHGAAISTTIEGVGP